MQTPETTSHEHPTPGPQRRYALYVRTAAQNGDTVTHQLAMLLRHVSSRPRALVCEVAIDDGSSAHDTHRSGLQRLLACAEQGRIDTLLTTDYGRLARCATSVWLLINKLRDCGVRVELAEHEAGDSDAVA